MAATATAGKLTSAFGVKSNDTTALTTILSAGLRRGGTENCHALEVEPADKPCLCSHLTPSATDAEPQLSRS
jgi:hypothetical protein